MSKQYVAGNLDEKTRKDLMKFLADTRDPRTGPALAKALNEYEPGKNDEDAKYAAKAVEGLAQAKKLVKEAGVAGQTITIGTSSQIASISAETGAYQQAAEAIGLKVVLKSVSAADYINFFTSAAAR